MCVNNFEEEREFSVKLHMYFKAKKGETQKEAFERIYGYLAEIEENYSNPCTIQVHEIEEQNV